MKMKCMFVVSLLLVLQYCDAQSQADDLKQNRHNQPNKLLFDPCGGRCQPNQYCEWFNCKDKKDRSADCGSNAQCISNRCVTSIGGRSVNSADGEEIEKVIDMANQKDQEEEAESRSYGDKYYRSPRLFWSRRCEACVANGCPPNFYCKTWIGNNEGVDRGHCLPKKKPNERCRIDRPQVCLSNNCICPPGIPCICA